MRFSNKMMGVKLVLAHRLDEKFLKIIFKDCQNFVDSQNIGYDISKLNLVKKLLSKTLRCSK